MTEQITPKNIHKGIDQKILFMLNLYTFIYSKDIQGHEIEPCINEYHRIGVEIDHLQQKYKLSNREIKVRGQIEQKERQEMTMQIDIIANRIYFGDEAKKGLDMYSGRTFSIVKVDDNYRLREDKLGMDVYFDYLKKQYFIPFNSEKYKLKEGSYTIDKQFYIKKINLIFKFESC